MRRFRFYAGLICISALLFIVPVLVSADQSVQSQWAVPPPGIDGEIGEWQGEPMALQKNVGVEYALRNDGENLYVLFIFKDPKHLSSIEMTGLTMYANTSGKKAKDFAVKFVKKTVSGEELVAYMESQGQPLSEERKQELIDKPQFVIFAATAVNKKGEEIFPAGPVPDVDLPGFRYGRLEGQVVYELRVPLCSRDHHPAGIGAEPGKALKLGFEWGGMTEEMKAAMRGRGGGMPGTDMTAERTTGSYSGPVPDVAKGPKKYSFWVDAKLASAQ
ncbi:MAG: hypothetical protein JXE07_02325 [Candidatus Aminicenantes bacterium]|nr:hypothetical protein [Candidatus Aminicenantes bacterium]